MSKKQQDIWISLDHETDGPYAGINNMLTFGAAAFDDAGVRLDTFYVRIKELPDLRPNPDTMIWWREQDSKAYTEAFDESPPGVVSSSISGKSRKTAFDAMLDFEAWLNYIGNTRQPYRFIPMGWPAVFDFAFTNYYCGRFLNKNSLGYAALDMRSYIMGLLRGKSYFSIKEEQVNSLFGMKTRGMESSRHVAVDDAIHQGELFFHIKNHPLASIEYLAEAARVI